MPNEAYVLRHLPEIIYAVLFAAVLFLPLRWAMAAFLVLSAVDIESSGQGLGPMNLAKGLVLPFWLLWRLRLHQTEKVAKLSTGVAAWAGLTVYVAIAGIWSLFPLASLKLVGHMAGMLVIAAVLTKAAKTGFLDARVVLPVAAGLVLLALLRAEFLPAYADEPQRFTAFTTAQSAAALITALYCVALSARDLTLPLRSLLCSCLACVLVFNGSRLWFLGIALATVLALAISQVAGWLKLCTAGVVILCGCLVTFEFDSLMRMIENGARSNRIASALTALYQGDATSSGLGTMNFRRKIDSLAVERVEHSSLAELFFGHGTCDGAMITGSLFHAYASYADPNRMFHNEWLRTLYEWGLVGFALWLVFIQRVVWFAVRTARASRGESGRPLLIYLPGFLLALGAENMIAGAGNAASMGFLLLLGLASAGERPHAESEAVKDVDYVLEQQASAGYSGAGY